MALGKCRECGKEVSTEAKACPHCGATKPVKQTSTFTWIVAGFFAICFGIAIFGRGSASGTSPRPQVTAAKTPEQLAADAKKEATFRKTAMAAAAVKSAMRDPDSLTWETIRANDDASVICMEYRARNGFGGMNREFAVLVNGKASQKPEAWNKHCTQPLTDMKHVKYALK